MKKDFHIGPIIFFIILILSSVWVGLAFAWDLPPAWEVKLTADDLTADADFGRSVAIDGNLVAVGAGGADAGETDGGSIPKAGAVYLFERRGLDYFLEAKLIAPDASTGAEFGRAVAIRGNMVIIGARFAEVEVEPGNLLSKAGAAYVFRKTRGAWHLEAKLTSPTPANEDNFGRALAIQGNILVVTARKENIGADDVGAAYVFLYKGGRWIDEAKLTASDPAAGAYFGQSVATQGNLIAVGARNADPNGAGAVYFFHRLKNQWVETAKVPSPDGKTDDQFAFAITIEGNLIAVGARRADLPGAKDAGAAYLFTMTGDDVTLPTKITASDAKAGDQFGQSIAMAGDVIAVGANRADIDGNKDQGAVYLFQRMGNEWVEEEKLTASAGMAGDEFGYSLSAFGNLMATGAHLADSTQGAAYVMPLRP
jgi:hypothetical protein